MAWLHTWTGLVPGWVLFLVFFTGTIAFFNLEISHWMKPELRVAGVSAKAIQAADELLRSRADQAEVWRITLPDDRGEEFSLGWAVPKGRFERTTLDPVTGVEVKPRDTRGGFFFYRFHFDFHYIPVMLARYIVSIASLAMLVAIVSGVVTHKKIFTDFFMLRFGKGQRSWLDAHNVTAVLALPFHLMITYTGLVIFSYLLIPSVIGVHVPDREAFFDRSYPHLHAEASGNPGTVMPLADLIRRAKEESGGEMPGGLAIMHPGDFASVVEVEPRSDSFPSARSHLYLKSATGEVFQRPQDFGPAADMHGLMVDLHVGKLAKPALRWLYFIAGVFGTAMIATGLVLWTAKRREKLPDPERPHFGFKLVERLNIGVISGLLGATAVYFLANRLLPLGLAGRAQWEIHCLFIAWGMLLAWSLARPAHRAWFETLAAGALLYALVPVANAATTSRGLFQSVAAGDWIFAAFDMTMLVVATIMAFGAWKLATRKAAPTRRRKSMALAEAAE